MVSDMLAAIGCSLKEEAGKSGMRMYCGFNRAETLGNVAMKSKLDGSRANVTEIPLNFSSHGHAILSKYLQRPQT
jgi:hypothetical protein